MEEKLERSAWVASPVSNKIGTVLFAFSAVMFILCFSNWMGMFGALKGVDSSYAEISGGFVKAGLIIFLPFFILHAVLSAGMFLGYNACTAITKSYGISVLIVDIVSLIATGIALSFILPTIASALGTAGQLLGNIGGMLDSFKDIANSVDKDTIRQFEEAAKEVAKLGADAIRENPELVSGIYEQHIGSIDPDIVAGAMAALKFLGCFAKIMLFLVLSQVFTIIGALLVKINSAKKTRLVALILCLFTWAVGGHLLYVGRTGKAVIRIILSVTFVLLIIPAILTIVDFFKILAGKFVDKEKQPVLEWV